jgi:hypothetical protein
MAMSIARLYKQVMEGRTPVQETAATSTVYVSWIDVVEYDPSPKRERLLSLSEEQLALLQEELSHLVGVNGTVLQSVADYGNRTLGLSLSVTDEAALKRAIAKLTEDETEVDSDTAILLIEQRGLDIPLVESDNLLTVDAVWSVPVILEETDADEISHPRDEEYYLTNLNDDLALKNAYLALYSRSSVTAGDGIHLVDAQILPENQLRLVFLGREGVDIPRFIRRMAGTGGTMDTLGMENLLLHTPHVHLHVDEDGEEEVEVAFDEETETQGSFDVSLPKGSVYLAPSKKPATRGKRA